MPGSRAITCAFTSSIVFWGPNVISQTRLSDLILFNGIGAGSIDLAILQAKCGCSSFAFAKTVRAWDAFNGEARVIGGCHAHSKGREATVGIQNGRVFIHKDSPKKVKSMLTHPFYLKELSTLLNSFDNASFELPFSFSLTTSDDGSAPSTFPSPGYCLHSSFPSHACVVNVVLPTLVDKEWNTPWSSSTAQTLLMTFHT